MTDYLTSSLPGTGGAIKQNADDFLVEEIPLYEACGSGEHLYLTVEKVGITTLDLIQKLSRALKVAPREIGYAGLKDARARTRQTFSLTGVKAEAVQSLQIPGVTLLAAVPHRNKLRLGHLAGNRFVIRIRNVEENALDKAEDILAVLADLGVPNRFGSQRYGSLNNSHKIGGALLRRDWPEAVRQIIGDPEAIRDPVWQSAAQAYAAGDLQTAHDRLPGSMRNEKNLLRALLQNQSMEKALLNLPRPLLRLYLSAWQSALFDRLVSMRLSSLATIWPGDLAVKHVNGAVFSVADPAAEQSRADAFEISPSAPLFGRKVPLASGQAGILEEALLAKEKLPEDAFRLASGLDLDGERRPLRVPLSEVNVQAEGSDLIVSFRLPKGSYATSVLREIMKNEQGSRVEESGDD